MLTLHCSQLALLYKGELLISDSYFAIKFNAAKIVVLVNIRERVKKVAAVKTYLRRNKMNSIIYLNVVLTAITILLLAILLQPNFANTEQGVELVSSAYAQAPEMKTNFLFSPIGNQQVRRFVFFDTEKNIIYDYKGNGKLDNVWFVKSLGENLVKK